MGEFIVNGLLGREAHFQDVGDWSMTVKGALCPWCLPAAAPLFLPSLMN